MFALTPAKRNRLILVVVVTALLSWALYTARAALFPFAGGMIAGYIILPLVNVLDHRLVTVLRVRKLSRGLSILIVYLLVGLGLGLIVAYLIPVLTSQFRTLFGSLPYLLSRSGDLLTDWLGQYETAIPVNLKSVINENAARLSTEIAQGIQTGITRTVTLVTTTISFILGIALIPIWLFYVLLDEYKAKKMFLSFVPRAQRQDARNIYTIIDSTLGAYLRGQLILGVTIGIMSTVALLIIGVEPALLLGIMAGLLEMLPYLGPIVAFMVTSLIALLQSPAKALWTGSAYLVIQQLESNLFVPQITGSSVRLHPAMVMIALVIGNELAGIWGMIMVVPLTAVIRDLVKYLYLRFSDVEVSASEALARVQGKEVPPPEITLDIYDAA